MKKAMVWLLVWALMGLGQAAAGPGSRAEASSGVRVQEAEEWDWLFTYDLAAAVPWTVKAAIPGEEEAYWYPWGSYDALEDGLGEKEAEQPKQREGGGGQEPKAQQGREAPQPPQEPEPPEWAEPEGTPQAPRSGTPPATSPCWAAGWSLPAVALRCCWRCRNTA